MPIYKIRGIEVDFPYEAYDCQIVYMEKVIQSLQESSNALLESPTGTGKTLCLLCATLAWRQSLGPFSTGQIGNKAPDYGNDMSEGPGSQSAGSKLPMIVYTSRTHSQLRQVVQELKRTNYRPKMVVLGSREQLCIHDRVRLLRGKAQTNACQYVRKRRTKHYCKHYKFVGDFIKNNPNLGDEPVDIEDLVNIGSSCGPCPYYVSRELHKSVDILFAPYNYLIDRGYRDSLSIGWKNSVLIFDEAHNLESICAEAASFDLPSSLLTACISEAKSCVDLSIKRRDIDSANDKKCNPDNFAILRALLLKLEKRIAEVPIGSKELGFTRPGHYIYELLNDLNITHKTSVMLNGIIEEAALLLEEEANGLESKESHEMKGATCRLETMGEILKIIFRDGDTSHARYYRVHVQESERSAVNFSKGEISRTLSWWCFNPGISMEDFSKRGVGSVILTSGTLSPMESFAQELKLGFPIRLENPHVITSDQIWAGAVPVGPSGYPLNSSYRNRDSLQYKQELGNAIVNFARIVPDGLLVFFPSYYVMERCIECWKDTCRANSVSSSTIWERICQRKLPVIEPRQSSLFISSIADYMSKLKNPSTSGAIFFAVCRGKVSEGLDFADTTGRAVIITGLPFATRTDPKVRLKREYLDDQQMMGSKNLTGEEWYDQQASRAVNQAVGRVIRHCHDFGAIIFCDERFASSHRQSQISRWIQPHIKCYSGFGDVVFSLTRFFRKERIQYPAKSPVSQAQDNGNKNGKNAFLPVDSLFSIENLSGEAVSVENKCHRSSPFSGIDHLRKVPPANRSYLTSLKQYQPSLLKHADLLSSSGRQLSVSSSFSQSKTPDIHELSSDSSQDGKQDGRAIMACSTKRRKIFETDHDSSDCQEVSCPNMDENRNPCAVINSLRLDKSVEGTRNLRRAQVTSSSLVDGDHTVQTRVSDQAKHSISSSSASLSSRDQESKGSAFLTQVQEKLTAAEYVEFVGYMKALKSKAMKIGPVLQSIARLFSSHERLPLLKRFQDFVPTRYHSLYEQYCAGE